MSYRFLCDHCGKKFELETPEAKECPFCFWTSSVKREDEAALTKKSASASFRKAVSGAGTKAPPGNLSKKLAFLWRSLLFVVLLAAAAFLALKGWQAYRASSSKSPVISLAKPGKETGKAPASVAAAPGIASLSAKDKEILYREVTVPADREPDPAEQAVLSKAVPFQTGWTEKLSSPVWTLAQYQKLIADQEAFYKMPFARSYKKKLEELFNAKYLAAADAFTQGDILAARNLWMESLAFPLYSTDLQKHRAVALTMLRPFINDTLSKVSAMNQSIMESGKRAKEKALSENYQKLAQLISQKKWQDALALASSMTGAIQELRKAAAPQEAPPAYPASFGTIDADLQRALMDLMAPAPSSTADLQPLQQDLVEKKEVIETFTEPYLQNAAAAYRAALEAIKAEKWQEAIGALSAIQGPPALQEDAIQKAAILAKIIPPGLDSAEKTD
ncbi:MAG TPA: hypothetical protein P5561_05305 [Candidatus Omnitrophota bacterium]|nr:hypothetical protein [Candidatus Omnitrophota bacterium]HRY85927.1 hypothetical protein [Candidatus Omnitrophota bacterium]